MVSTSTFTGESSNRTTTINTSKSLILLERWSVLRTRVILCRRWWTCGRPVGARASCGALWIVQLQWRTPVAGPHNGRVGAKTATQKNCLTLTLRPPRHPSACMWTLIHPGRIQARPKPSKFATQKSTVPNVDLIRPPGTLRHACEQLNPSRIQARPKPSKTATQKSTWRWPYKALPAPFGMHMNS